MLEGNRAFRVVSRQSCVRSLALCRRMIFEIPALCGNAVSQVLGVVPDAPDEAGPPARLPGQSQEIDAGLGRDAALVLRPTALVESIDLQPTIVSDIACRPDDGRNAAFCQIEFEYRVGQAFRVEVELAGLRLLREIETITGNIGVGLVQQRQ